jgi:DNA replication protein DnaC
MSELQDVLIAAHLKTLKLPGIRKEYAEVARRASADSWSYEEYLRELLETEIRLRESRTATRRLREARFPEVKTLEQIDWSALQGVSKHKIVELASCGFIEKAEDLIIAGPIGTGNYVKRSLM